MTDQRVKELEDEITYLRRELQTEKQERIRINELLSEKYNHCSKLMKERDELAFRLRKIQAAFEKESASHNLDRS